MKKTDDTPHIIVAEDNARDVEYLLSALSGVTHDVVSRGDDALELFESLTRAWLISDVQLPGITGVELSAKVWALEPTTRIIIWSQYDDEIYLRALTRAMPPDALYGYVLKNNPSTTLQRAVYSVFFEEQCWLDPQVRPIQARNRQSDRIITDAEYEVLVDIALGMTDELIATRRFLSRRGVQSRLTSLYSKLDLDRATIDPGLNPRSRAVAIALNRGLLNQNELDRAEEDFTRWRKNKSH